MVKGAENRVFLASPGPKVSLFSGRSQTPPAGFSVVDDKLVIHGDLDTNGTIRVDGQVSGSLHRAGTLIVGAGGTVVGNVEAREVIVAGAIHGNVNARGRVEIEPGAVVNGEIHATTMFLHDGGTANGYLAIGGEPQAPVRGRQIDVAPPQTRSRSRG